MDAGQFRPILEVSGLTVRLPAGADRDKAVDGVSLHVAAGEVLCLVGESGSGKSLTAKAIMGLLSPASFPHIEGQIRLDGADLLSLRPRARREMAGRRLSMIFQEPMTALNPVMPVGRQIEEVLIIHEPKMPAPARRKAVLDVLHSVRLPDPPAIFATFSHQLSGGQRQRVMIAMALIMQPSLLIADEPTTALDVTTQAQILALVRDLQRRQGTGVLFITHDIGVVAEIADRIAVMHQGSIVETGPAHDVLRNPLQAYTRMLISSVPSLAPPHRERISASAALALSVEGLAKTYSAGGWFRGGRTVVAVRPVSLSIARGEIVSVVGESGSGKTTLARCVAGLVKPSAGNIRIGARGGPVGGAGDRLAARRQVQMVFQDPNRSLNPRLTVGRSIVEGPRNFGETAGTAWATARDLVTLVGLSPDALDRYPHQFSGGQRQRLCIARALAMKPDVLIADEAVSALDVSVQRQVLELLDSIRKRLDLAILFITHDLRVAAHISDRMLVMSRGELVEQGTPTEVLTSPRHPYTVSLLASVPGRNYAFVQPVPEPVGVSNGA